MQNHVPTTDWYDDPVPVEGDGGPSAEAGASAATRAAWSYTRRRAARLPRRPARPATRRPSSSSTATTTRPSSATSCSTRTPASSSSRRRCSIWSNRGPAPRAAADHQPERLPAVRLRPPGRAAAALLRAAHRGRRADRRPRPRTDRHAGRHASSTEAQLTPEQQQLLHDYRLVQYDFSIGERYAVDEHVVPVRAPSVDRSVLSQTAHDSAPPDLSSEVMSALRRRPGGRATRPRQPLRHRGAPGRAIRRRTVVLALVGMPMWALVCAGVLEAPLHASRVTGPAAGADRRGARQAAGRALVLWLVLVLLWCVTGRLWASMGILLGLTATLSAVNVAKMAILTEPLYPSDYQFLGSTSFLLEMVAPTSVVAGVLGLVLLAVGTVAAGRFMDRRYPRLRRTEDAGAWARLVGVRVLVGTIDHRRPRVRVAVQRAGQPLAPDLRRPGRRLAAVPAGAELPDERLHRRSVVQHPDRAHGLCLPTTAPRPCARSRPGTPARRPARRGSRPRGHRRRQRGARARRGVRRPVPAGAGRHAAGHDAADPRDHGGDVVGQHPGQPLRHRHLQHGVPGADRADHRPVQAVRQLAVPELHDPAPGLPLGRGLVHGAGPRAHRGAPVPRGHVPAGQDLPDARLRRVRPRRLADGLDRLEDSEYISDEAAFAEVREQIRDHEDPLLVNLVTMQNHVPAGDSYADPSTWTRRATPPCCGRWAATPAARSTPTRRSATSWTSSPQRRADSCRVLRGPLPGRPDRRGLPRQPRARTPRDAPCSSGPARDRTRVGSRSPARHSSSPTSSTWSASPCRPTTSSSPTWPSRSGSSAAAGS